MSVSASAVTFGATMSGNIRCLVRISKGLVPVSSVFVGSIIGGVRGDDDALPRLQGVREGPGAS